MNYLDGTYASNIAQTIINLSLSKTHVHRSIHVCVSEASHETCYIGQM